MKAYRRVYSELAGMLDSEGCYVADVDSPGLCVKGAHVVVIVIRATLSWKKKLFVLVHEAGHAYKLVGGKLVRDYTDLELEANSRAIDILKYFEFEDDIDSYWEFYERERKVTRRKPWFKI